MAPWMLYKRSKVVDPIGHAVLKSSVTGYRSPPEWKCLGFFQSISLKPTWKHYKNTNSNRQMYVWQDQVSAHKVTQFIGCTSAVVVAAVDCVETVFQSHLSCFHSWNAGIFPWVHTTLKSITVVMMPGNGSGPWSCRTMYSMAATHAAPQASVLMDEETRRRDTVEKVCENV